MSPQGQLPAGLRRIAHHEPVEPSLSIRDAPGSLRVQ